LVELVPLAPGQHVLDAATGTGFAAIAAAQRVGPGGRVVGVDLSAGMLREATTAATQLGLAIEFVLGDAVRPGGFSAASFEAITCAAGLLYMPVDDALAAWSVLLKPGGFVAFSGLRAGSPLAGRLFRACAAEFGLRLTDPSAALGTEDAARDALERANYTVHALVGETIVFSAQDLSLAWESNLRSAGHEAVRGLEATAQEALRSRYPATLAAEQRADPQGFAQAEILYAVGRRA
jgi:ubiquinone/menaquinone biosynthesis C-methylase UbiE